MTACAEADTQKDDDKVTPHRIVGLLLAGSTRFYGHTAHKILGGPLQFYGVGPYGRLDHFTQ